MWLPNYPEVISPLSMSEVKKAHSFSRNSSHVLRDEFGWVSRNSLWMFHFVILWPCGLRINRQDTGSLNTISSTQVHKSLRTSESKMMKEKWLSRYWESAVHLRKYTGEYRMVWNSCIRYKMFIVRDFPLRFCLQLVCLRNNDNVKRNFIACRSMAPFWPWAIFEISYDSHQIKRATKLSAMYLYC